MNLDCLCNTLDFEMLVGTWLQCAMKVSLVIGDGKTCTRVPNNGRNRFLAFLHWGSVDTCEGVAVLGGNGKVVKASMLSLLSARARERALKESLKIMAVVGVGLHLLRVALAELKKGADLAVSKKVSSVMTWVVW